MQPSELRFYRSEDGIAAVSLLAIHTPREDGIVERTELYIPAVGWFRETVNDIYEALVELMEMTAEKAPEVGE